MALYNTQKYGDGTLYSDPNKTYRVYGAVADPNASTTGGLSFVELQRPSLKISQSGGVFIIQALRPNVDDAGVWPNNFNVNADVENVQYVSLKFQHSNGTLFQIQQIRPVVEVRIQEPIG